MGSIKRGQGPCNLTQLLGGCLRNSVERSDLIRFSAKRMSGTGGGDALLGVRRISLLRIKQIFWFTHLTVTRTTATFIILFYFHRSGGSGVPVSFPSCKRSPPHVPFSFQAIRALKPVMSSDVPISDFHIRFQMQPPSTPRAPRQTPRRVVGGSCDIPASFLISVHLISIRGKKSFPAFLSGCISNFFLSPNPAPITHGPAVGAAIQ